MTAQPAQATHAFPAGLVLKDDAIVTSRPFDNDTIHTTIQDDAGTVIATLQTSTKTARLIAHELTREAVKIGIDRIIAAGNRLAYDPSYVSNVLGVAEADEVATYNQQHGIGALQDITVTDAPDYEASLAIVQSYSKPGTAA